MNLLITKSFTFFILFLNIFLFSIFKMSYSTFTFLSFSVGLLGTIYLKNLNKCFYYCYCTLFSVSTISFILIMFIVNLGVNYKNINNSYDTIIVLGSGLQDGDKLSYVLTRRLETALEYHKKNPSTPIILSGGQGHDELLSEAQAMKNYLISKGIPENILFLEDKSTSTKENIIFSKEIIKKNDFSTDKIGIITNDYHSFRSNHLSKKLGLNSESISAKTSNFLKINYMVREYFACVKSFLIDK